jgi:CheY-like chemotaxis protein
MLPPEEAPLVLFIDRNKKNAELLAAFLTEAGYRTQALYELPEVDALLEHAAELADIALALVDLQGFEPSIWERCRALHEAHVPFIVIARPHTAEAQQQVRRRSHGAGARHTLTKPMRKEQLLTLVRILTGTDD